MLFAKYDVFNGHIDREVQQINWALAHLREKDAYFSQELGGVLARAVASRRRAQELRSSVAGRLTIPQQQPPPQPTPSPAAPADRAPLRKPARETQGEKWDVFVSHASEDKAYVDPLVTALEAAGISVWYDRLVLKWGDDLRPVIGRNSTVPSKPPHSAASPGPKPNAIAFAQYEGPAGRRVHLLVRKSATEENMFTLEDADGQEHEGARQDIALKYTLADKRLTMNGFKRMQNSGGSEYPEFNL